MGTSPAGWEMVRVGDDPVPSGSFRCETVLNILGKKWMIPVLAELEADVTRLDFFS